MKRISYITLSVVLAVAVGFGGYALACQIPESALSLMINSAVVSTYLFNDCPEPVSSVAVVNNYPFLISIDNTNLICTAGFANRHAWSFSEDGATLKEFANSDNFEFGATVVLSGSSEGEGGLRLSPWWSPEIDGVFMLNSKTGEIACFAGRLPFYSFTANHGVSYVKGTAARMGIEYHANGLSMASPATVEYKLTMGGSSYSSGPLPFDEGNPAEDPPHGLWGILDPAYAGGYLQCYIADGEDFKGEWRDICFVDLSPVQTEQITWGQVKSVYR